MTGLPFNNFLSEIKMNRFKPLLLAISLLLSIATPFATHANEKFKVAFVFDNTIRTHGWNFQHDLGRLYLEQQLGDQIETNFLESIPRGDDAVPVLLQLANSGYQMIFTTSYVLMDPTVEAATFAPDILFENSTGTLLADNVSTYNGKFYEGRYVLGRIAGAMTKSNVIGYVASYPVPEVIRGVNSFVLGLRSINRDAIVKLAFVENWNDPVKDAIMATELVNKGADILAQHTDSTGVMMAAEELGVYAFGQTSDMRDIAPTAQLTAIVLNWGPYYVERVKAAINGTWNSGNKWYGMSEGIIEMADYNAEALSTEIISDARSIADQIRTGELHPFTGPIYDQNGRETVSAGQVVTDEALSAMDYFVPGIEILSIN